LTSSLRQAAAAYLDEELSPVVIELVEGGRRIPEEALGTKEMRHGMRAIKL
jgi:hypothetical protein